MRRSSRGAVVLPALPVRSAPSAAGLAAGLWWPLLLAAVGALQTPAFVATWAWPLPLAGAALLAWSTQQVPPRRAAWFGWLYGTAWLTAGTWWVYISMHRYGGLAAPLAAAAVVALAGALSLYLAAAMALFAHWRQGRPVADAALFAAVWLLAELARGALFTGFPWVASGYAQVDGPLAALAPWVGVYGIGGVTALAAALLAAALMGATHRQRVWPAVAAIALLAAPALVGTMPFSRPSALLTVSLLQTNVPQDDKFAAEQIPQALAWVAAALRDARGSLVVAPETAVALLPDQLTETAPGYWPALQARFANDARQTALIGVPLGDFTAGYTNSVAGLSQATAAAGADYRYDKQHLVPFGEFIPRGFRWFTELMNIPLGDFNRGPQNPPSFAVHGERVGPNICFEDLFGEELALRFANPAAAPTLFANVSNMGWFGDDGTAIRQHLNISRMRTLELQRPMVRATNTGATAIIDHRGRVVAALPPGVRGVLEGQVQGQTGVTPFGAWAARFSLWPLLLAALAVLGVTRTLAAIASTRAARP